MKRILTQDQAVSILYCLQNKIDPDLFHAVEKNHKLYKLSLEELEKKIFEHLEEDNIAGVVTNPQTVSKVKP